MTSFATELAMPTITDVLTPYCVQYITGLADLNQADFNH